MTPGDKELLLKDLCARLPYGVMLKHISIEKPFKLFSIKRDEYASYKKEGIELATNGVYYDWYINDIYHDIELYIKPYLFPLSSMTEEQKQELFFNYIHNDIYFDDFTDYFLAGELWHDICVSMDALPLLINWLNKNCFDIYGLIPKGLAIDATGLNIY